MQRLLCAPEGTFSMKHIGAVTPRTVPDSEDPSKNVVLATVHLNGGQVIETTYPYEDAADAYAQFVKNSDVAIEDLAQKAVGYLDAVPPVAPSAPSKEELDAKAATAAHLFKAG